MKRYLKFETGLGATFNKTYLVIDSAQVLLLPRLVALLPPGVRLLGLDQLLRVAFLDLRTGPCLLYDTQEQYISTQNARFLILKAGASPILWHYVLVLT